MMILMNPRAAGGTAARKWQRIAPVLQGSGVPYSLQVMDSIPACGQLVAEAMNRGETDFVAAGGDGTVNALLNMLLSHATANQRATLRLGAVGLGSSNDFHKPFSPTAGIPCRIEFDEAQWRDVGVLHFDDHGSAGTRYFLINASIGVTAAANRLFNEPDPILRSLKPLSTGGAILYSALKTILTYRNLVAQIQVPGTGEYSVNLSNLAVLKNPHFSGNFRFPDRAHYDDGRFMVCLFRNMQRGDLLSALHRLRRGRMPVSANAVSWSVQSLTVSAREQFAVEFDGEVLSTSNARFEILPRYLKVCPCSTK